MTDPCHVYAVFISCTIPAESSSSVASLNSSPSIWGISLAFIFMSLNFFLLGLTESLSCVFHCYFTHPNKVYPQNICYSCEFGEVLFVGLSQELCCEEFFECPCQVALFGLFGEGVVFAGLFGWLVSGQ